jgi:nucleoside-diphosphate-sugar epimerase
VVILGSSGVIGKVLTRFLLDKGLPLLTISSADINLLDPSAARQLARVLNPTDSVVVLSGLPLNRGRGLAMMVDNVNIGLAIAAAIAQVPVAQVVYMSSDAVYPRRIEEIHELTDTEPSDPYAAMHLIRERVFSSLGPMPVAVLRSTQVSSPEDTHNAYGPNRFRRMMFAEQRIVLFGKGEELRDHIMVQDVAAIIYLCLIHRSQGTLNVATGRSLTFSEVAGNVASHCTSDTKI